MMIKLDLSYRIDHKIKEIKRRHSSLSAFTPLNKIPFISKKSNY